MGSLSTICPIDCLSRCPKSGFVFSFQRPSLVGSPEVSPKKGAKFVSEPFPFSWVGSLIMSCSAPGYQHLSDHEMAIPAQVCGPDGTWAYESLERFHLVQTCVDLISVYAL